MPPRTALERDLVSLWADLLNVRAVGIHDNFFELGGHSLLAVQLLSRVRQIYGVDLSLEVVYSGEFTVAELAKAIELKEIEQAGGDYQELLAGARRPVRRRGARAAGRRAGCRLSANADPADRQRLLRSAARRRHAQQSASGWTTWPRAGPRLPHRLRRLAAKAPNCGIHASIALFAVEDPARRVQVLRQQIREFQPDWVLVSSEDLGHGLLREAHHSAAGRVVYLAHTPQFFPFGPASWNPDRARRRPGAPRPPASSPSGITWPSTSSARWAATAAVIHPPIYGAGPFADYANFDAGWSP